MQRLFRFAPIALLLAAVAGCGGSSSKDEPTALPVATATKAAPTAAGSPSVTASATPATAPPSRVRATSPTAASPTVASSSTSAPATKPASTQPAATQAPPPTSTPKPSSGNPLSATVGVTGTARYFWSPNSLKIAPGGTVTFSWTDSAAHDLSVPGVGFESGEAKTSATYTITFPSAGEYEMICIIHSQTMKGKIIVE